MKPNSKLFVISLLKVQHLPKQIFPVKLFQVIDKYYYTYVLQSEVNLKLYTGYTKNLKQRFEQHNKGLAPQV